MGQKLSAITYDLVHGVFLISTVFGLIWYGYECGDFHYFIKYFSNHGLQLAVLYSITSFVSSTKKSKVNQILHEVAFTTNLIACLGYWIIVRPEVHDKIAESFLLACDFTHTVPILMIIGINFLEQLEYFQMKNIKYQYMFMVFTISINAFYTFWDQPVYLFMTWRDIGTVIFIVGGLIFLYINFLLMSKLSQSRTNRNNNRSKNIKTQ